VAGNERGKLRVYLGAAPGVDAVRLYESYLSNFGFANGDEA